MRCVATAGADDASTRGGVRNLGVAPDSNIIFTPPFVADPRLPALERPSGLG